MPRCMHDHHRAASRVFAVALTLVTSLFVLAARGTPSIFDDDWTPPQAHKTVAPPQDLRPTKSTPTTRLATTTDSSAPEPTLPSVANATPSRRPVPEKAAQ